MVSCDPANFEMSKIYQGNLIKTKIVEIGHGINKHARTLDATLLEDKLFSLYCTSTVAVN